MFYAFPLFLPWVTALLKLPEFIHFKIFPRRHFFSLIHDSLGLDQMLYFEQSGAPGKKKGEVINHSLPSPRSEPLGAGGMVHGL